MKQLFKYFLALMITFLAGYFVFNEFLIKPEISTIPTSVTVHETETPEEKEEFTLHEFYSNPLDGIEIGFPEGFEAQDWGVSFGPKVTAPESPAGKLSHQYEMQFIETRTILEAEEYAKSDPTIEYVDSDLFGDFTVVRYIEGGMCSYATIEIIGFKHNYKFAPGCGVDDDADFAYMESIIETGALIPDNNDPAWKYCESVGKTVTTFTADQLGGQYSVYVAEEKTFEECLINDGLDGIRCDLQQYFNKECGHPGSHLSPTQ